MPRNGSGVMSWPANTAAIPNTTIESTKYNAFLADLLSDLNDARPITAGGTGATDQAGARTNLGITLANLNADTQVLTKTGAYTAVLADRAALIRFTSAATLSLTAAATLGVDWYVDVVAVGVDVTIDPNAAETIDGAATLVIPAGMSARVVSDGTAFYTTLTKTAKFSSTAAGTVVTVESTDAGASLGPSLDLYRNSASPAVNDGLGLLLFSGKDSAGNKALYGNFHLVVSDPTSGSQDGRLVAQTMVAGALANRMVIGAGAYMDGATGGDPGAGKFNANELQQAGTAVRPLVSGTAQATTSGTSKDFTGFPSWAQKVTINLSNVSTNGTSPIIIQIGSGSIATTGYMGAGGGQDTAGGSIVNFTAGFGLVSPGAAADFINGVGTLTLLDAATNTWAFGWSGGISNGNYVLIGGGSKALSGVLDRVRLTTLGGTAAFDSGLWNIMYE